MKTRMFQQIVFLPILCIVCSGCQSGPFASRSQSSGTLAQQGADTENESAIQKNLREAMAEERAKVRSGTKRRNDQAASAASLAERSGKDQRQNRLPAAAESKNLPLSSPQQASRQPDDSTVQQELNLAYDADRTGNIEKAQGYYQRVLALDPANYEALHRLAIIEDKKQNFPAAEAYYLRALKIDSTNADLLSDIGYSYMLQGRDDYGEKYLHEALKFQPGHARSLDHLGWFYGRAGQYDQALALFRMTSGEAQAQLKFAQLFPDAELNNHLAQGNMTQGNMITQHQVQMVAPQNTAPGIQPIGQFQADLNQPVQTADSEYPVEQTTPMLTSPGMNPTQQIAEMMKREREKAMQARNMPEQLPAIMPNQVMTNQMSGDPAYAGTVQDTRQLTANPSGMTPAPAGGIPQIQAWPPVGDPGISQAAEASNYWAMKEQQQKQNQQAQQLQQQMQQRQYQNYMSQQGGQPMQQEQYQNQNMPYNNSQMNGRQSPQQGMSGNFPQGGQPMYGNQYQAPGQFPDYRINSTQSPNQQRETNSAGMQQRNDQELIREAARTGMNLGPGQMFPVAVNGQENTNNSRLMSAQFPANTLLPASAQVADQNIYQAGGQNIRQSQVGQPLYQQQQQQGMGIRQAGYEFPNQQIPHSNGLTSFEQNWNGGGIQQASSTLPPSAMYSHNQEVAPANMRSSNSNVNQGVSGNMYQNGMNPPRDRRQNPVNQNPNQQAPSSYQWGAQQSAAPSQYPVQQSQY